MPCSGPAPKPSSDTEKPLTRTVGMDCPPPTDFKVTKGKLPGCALAETATELGCALACTPSRYQALKLEPGRHWTSKNCGSQICSRRLFLLLVQTDIRCAAWR